MTATASELVHSSIVAPSQTAAIPAQREKSRDSAIDVLRGLAIIGVVYVHGCWLLGNGASAIIPADWFRYDVGSFIAIAAYLAARSTSSVEYWPAVGKRIARLWFPFIVWSLLYFACSADLRTLTPTKVLTRHFLGYGWAGQYYFLILFQLAFVQPFFRRWRLSTGAVAAIYAASALWLLMLHCRIPGSAFALKLAERPVVYWAPFIALGVWLARNRETLERHAARIPTATIAVVALLASCAPLVQDHFFPHNAVARALTHLRSSNLVGSTAFFLGAWLLARRGAFGACEGLLRVLGRYVLGIFCLNTLVVRLLDRLVASSHLANVIPHWLGPFTCLISVALVLLLSLAASAAIDALGGSRLVR
jgi:fucose 4-O-acetylase-like acetyltransferase